MSPSHPLFLLVASSLSVVMATGGIDAGSDPFPTPTYPPFPDFHVMEGNFTDPTELESYCQMLQQSPTPVPPEEIPWFCMCTKCQTMPGPKGERGDRGPPGRPGRSGRRGLTGFRGPPGFVGRQGIKGQKGDGGEKGRLGLEGPMGPKGATGFKGEKGEHGFEGRPGDPGPKGDDGVCPDVCEFSVGAAGLPGLPGTAGPRGRPGVQGLSGPKGDKGDLGDLGLPGVPGLVGGKGEPGPQGDCNCTDGADGIPGKMGSKGDKGEQGEMGPHGKTGPQGDKGDMGDTGMTGVPGPCMPSIQSSFAAKLTSSYPPPLIPVVFGHVLYNTGSYDPSSGIYTAPVNGTYVFSYQLTAYERVLKVGLFRNNAAVVKSTEVRDFGVASQSVVLHLSRGDRVWILMRDDATNGMYASSEASSSFSGFLLYPDSCEMPFGRDMFTPGADYEDKYDWDD